MTTKPKPDYVTREAERFRNAPPGNRRRSDDVKALIRRVLRRAARECERTYQAAIDNAQEAAKRESFNNEVYYRAQGDGALLASDAIRALAKGGRE